MMTEKECWDYLSKAENWEKIPRKAHGFDYLLYVPRGSNVPGLCLSLFFLKRSGLISTIIRRRMGKKINKHHPFGGYIWSNVSRHGNYRRRMWCKKQAKLCR